MQGWWRYPRKWLYPYRDQNQEVLNIDNRVCSKLTDDDEEINHCMISIDRALITSRNPESVFTRLWQHRSGLEDIQMTPKVTSQRAIL
jgi:hypothetical protein